MIYYILFTLMLGISLFCLWRISVTDFRRRIIPDAYLFPLLICGLVVTTWFPWPTDAGTGAIGAACGYALAAIVGKIFTYIHPSTDKYTPPIGMGDIKLIAVGGLWVGPTGLASTLVIACILGIIWGRANHQKYIPFAPFFAVGGILSLIVLCFLL